MSCNGTWHSAFNRPFPRRHISSADVVEHARAVQRMLRLAAISEQHRRGADHLEIDAIAVHLFEPDVYVPAGRSDLPERAVAKHDHCFAWTPYV